MIDGEGTTISKMAICTQKIGFIIKEGFGE